MNRQLTLANEQIPPEAPSATALNSIDADPAKT